MEEDSLVMSNLIKERLVILERLGREHKFKEIEPNI